MKTFFALYIYGIYKYYTHELFHILYTRHKNSFCQLFNNLVKLLLQFKKFVISPRLEHCYSCKLQKPLTNLPLTFCIQNEDVWGYTLHITKSFSYVLLRGIFFAIDRYSKSFLNLLNIPLEAYERKSVKLNRWILITKVFHIIYKTNNLDTKQQI